MTVDTSSRRSRRARLGAARGAVAATVASAFGRADVVRATDGDIVHQGDTLGTSRTTLVNTSDFAIGAEVNGTTVAINATTTQRSRRAIIAGALGGAAALVAQSVSRPLTARANDGDIVHIGDFSISGNTLETRIATSAGKAFVGESTASNGWGLFGAGPGGGVVGWGMNNGCGLTGQSQSVLASLVGPVAKTGVYGVAHQDTTSRGVLGRSTAGVGVQGEAVEDFNNPSIWGAGVVGFSGPAGGAVSHDKTGVMGYAAQDATSRGVIGQSTAGRGVYGIATNGTGVYGSATAGEGVHGVSNSSNGVSGTTAVNFASGVYGENTGSGYGTYGRSNTGAGFGAVGESTAGTGVTGLTTSGVGGRFSAGASGTALQTQGRVSFSTAGLAPLAAGVKSKVVTPGTDITATSLVLCTLESNQGGLYIQRVVKSTTANTFTVYLSALVASGKYAKVGWFVIG